MTFHKALGLTLLTALLSGCQDRNTNDDYVILTRFDPNIASVKIEEARSSAIYAPRTVVVTPGKYCQTFVKQVGSQSVTGRIELNLLSKNRYFYATRFAYNNLVRRHSELGYYTTKGHVLILTSSAGTDRQIALTSVTPQQINVWGELPLSRDCETVLRDSALGAAERSASAEQDKPYPWEE
ncbi:hypothetical protein [Deinococcus ficus]|uniref:Lipoprotein n=1 Tax=Deinococcus ficus TaxID=317577 RepID=A0A221T2R2_9DEIO|nr:hypothetical protein [Deinococcus ficus]ASN83185.1 hypothetical protein DFI_18465 [Deinococcus ficus]